MKRAYNMLTFSQVMANMYAEQVKKDEQYFHDACEALCLADKKVLEALEEVK